MSDISKIKRRTQSNQMAADRDRHYFSPNFNAAFRPIANNDLYKVYKRLTYYS